MARRCAIAAILLLLALASPVLAIPARAAQDQFFITDDGVRLHYLEAGTGHTLVFIPGWTMPAWIFDRQIADFSRHYHVIALDPRGQGDSDIPATGYNQDRRGRDIASLLAHLGPAPVLLVGWSLGVLDSLAYVHMFGDAHLAGLVLIDNSVGEEPAPVPAPPPRHPPPRLSREDSMRAFVRSMFRHPQPAAYLEHLTETCLRVPARAAAQLLNYPVPRTYWREGIYATDKPILYVVRPGLSGQAGNLQAHHPGAESVVLRDVGHAMFVDDTARFDKLMQDFIFRRIWPNGTWPSGIEH